MKTMEFRGNLVIVGFGGVGQGTLPLILRHLSLDRSRITILTADERGRKVADHHGVRFVINPLTRANYRDILTPLLGPGDFLLNVSVDVSSLALVEFCRERGAFYQDTCIEPWAGGYTDASLSPSARSNYALREQALAMKTGSGPTALITHGANPGLVSHFVKQALLDIAAETGLEAKRPRRREEWAALMHRLGVRTIHVAERDTQISRHSKTKGEFVNTWSVDGFLGEGCQPAELGWGTHEKELPPDGRRHDFGAGSAIYLMRPGAATKVRTWTPMEGAFHGFLITHGESISTADYYTVREAGQVLFRPTVHYAYHPCDDAVLSLHELAGRGWAWQKEHRLLGEDIVSGVDELGVLLMGHAKGAYWYGSQLSIDEARKLCPFNNATTLQVTATILAGMMWCLENPARGVVEPEEIDFDYILDVARPYLGRMVGAYSAWTPLAGRGRLFPEDIDTDDPWQFKNFRVA